MTSIPPKQAFWRGFTNAVPFTLVVVPFGLLFGVVARDAGIALDQAMAMTTLVIAGASQFAAVDMLSDHAALAIVIVAALGVNLRMAMYSAALVPHLGNAPLWQRALVAYVLFDQTYAISVARFEREPDWSPRAKAAFVLGTATPIAPMWIGCSLIGALLGQAIPMESGLDFVVPITFLSLLGPMLKSLPQVVAALVSAVLGVALCALPTGTGLLIAAVAAMITGATVESWLEKRRAR